MIKTLYSRIVLAFLGIILISLLVASYFGLTLFKQRISQDGQGNMLLAAQKIEDLYQELEPTDLDTFMLEMAQLTNYPIHLVKPDHTTVFYSLNNNNTAKLSDEATSQVLKGHTYYSLLNKEETYVGMPLMIEEKPYGIFLQYSYENEKIFNLLLLFILTLALLISSCCILFAARYLVRPLKDLRKATEQIATGDFSVNLALKRQDEVGELAQSFNIMTAELQKIEQMRQDFVANVSHEIQSPLTSISGFAKALKHQQLIPEDQRDYYLDIIISESQRLSRLGDNLLKLASLDSEHHPFYLTEFNLTEQLREIILLTAPNWETKQLDVVLVTQEAVLVTADQELLQQVWFNLLTNSIKFTPEHGQITIQVTAKNQQIIITITDNGIGMPEDELVTIFERFYKTDKSHNRQQAGNGLGLAIVKKIVTLHHGQIKAESQLNQGTTMIVILPKNE